MWWLAISLAAAQTHAPTATGLARTHGDVTTLDPGQATLLLRNPHVARSRLWVDALPLGWVNPRSEVRIHGIRAGEHAVSWKTPSGYERHDTVSAKEATPPSPERSPRTSER